MKNGVILYRSRRGAAEEYARWLAEELGFDLQETKKADIREVSRYRVVILGGGVYASKIEGISFLRRYYSAIRHCRVIVFCTGMAPLDEEMLRRLRETNLKGETAEVPCFYCRGAWDEDRLSVAEKLLCGMLRKAAAKKDPAGRDPLEETLLSVGRKQDWTDRAYLLPILEEARR